jgi:hypothetical protein
VVVGVGAVVGEDVDVGVAVEVDVNVAVILWEASMLLNVYDDAVVTGVPSTVIEAME